MSNGCRTNKPGHDFDPDSGWCANNCGKRDDGRLVILGSVKIPGPYVEPSDR